MSKALNTDLATESRQFVGTAQAALYLDRSPRSLAYWADKLDSPLKPVRILGRLAWPVREIRAVMGVSE